MLPFSGGPHKLSIMTIRIHMQYSPFKHGYHIPPAIVPVKDHERGLAELEEDPE